MTSPKSVKKTSATSRARPERLSCVLFLSSGRKTSQKSCFQYIFQVQTVYTHFSISDNHAELLKNYFNPLVKKLKFSTLVAKSDLRCKVH